MTTQPVTGVDPEVLKALEVAVTACVPSHVIDYELAKSAQRPQGQLSQRTLAARLFACARERAAVLTSKGARWRRPRPRICASALRRGPFDYFSRVWVSAICASGLRVALDRDPVLLRDLGDPRPDPLALLDIDME